MSASSDKMMQAMLGKLYQVLNAGDNPSLPSPGDNFIAWSSPGIPMDEEDLEFIRKGVLGGTTVQDLTESLNEAEDFARLVNLIPDVSGIYDQKQQAAAYKQDGTLLWDVYEEVLRMSQVASFPLTPEEKTKLDNAQKVLTATEKRVTGVDGNFNPIYEEATADSPMMEAYTEKSQAYDEAFIAYNSARISAINSDSKEAVQSWTLNGSSYRRRRDAAYKAWVSRGFKNIVELAQNHIEQITQRDAAFLKDKWQRLFENAVVDNQTTGSTFYYTSLLPGTFAEKKWPEFDFAEHNVSTYDRREVNAWSAGTSVSLGLFGAFSFGASSSGEIVKTKHQLDMSNFKMSCELVEVPISRPWLSASFLKSRGWRFKNNDFLSDGQRPPSKDGKLPAYTTSVIFVRNLLVDFAELHQTTSTYTQTIKAGGGVSIGPFRIGGSYSRKVGERKFESTFTPEGLWLPDMQVIGFRCALLPKSPNPDPSIPNWT